MIPAGDPHPPAASVLDQIRTALRSPYLPSPLAELARADGYLEVVWPQLERSVETAGFIGSALYVADMALDTVERVYEPVFTSLDLQDAGMTEDERIRLVEVIDVFHYVQPQLLLLLAALAEAFERDEVGGHGKLEPRPVTDGETHHLATVIPSTTASAPPLPVIAEALGLDEAPDLYRAVAAWPGYVGLVWDEIQHLAAYPEFRRRGRALYFYARSGARFLADPLRANPAALREAGVSDRAIESARDSIDTALPATAMLLMHAEAMRVGLDVAVREVVQVEKST